MCRYKLSILFAISLLMFSCQTNNKKVETSKNQELKEQEMNIERPLDSLLNVRRVEFDKVAPEEKKRIYADGIEAVRNSGILKSALNVGDKVPDFTLNDQMKQSVTLYDELKKGPAILTWYRGGWCPYCNINLHFLQERLPDFQKAGATLIALTPELPDKSMSTTEKHELQFYVLSDVGNQIGKKYGVVFQLTPEVASIYQEAFDLHGYNGDQSNELPLAATYVIDGNGIVQYAFLDADYRNRAEPDEILAALKRLKAKK